MTEFSDRPANAMDCTLACVACAVTASLTAGLVNLLAIVGLVLFAVLGFVLLWREHTDRVNRQERIDAEVERRMREPNRAR